MKSADDSSVIELKGSEKKGGGARVSRNTLENNALMQNIQKTETCLKQQTLNKTIQSTCQRGSILLFWQN